MKTNLMKKVLGFVLTLVMVCSMLPMTSNAAEGTTVYFKPNNNWKDAGAWCSAYCFNDYENTWIDLTDTDGDGYFVGTVPAGYNEIIFCRMNPAINEKTWDAKWTQTADLEVPAIGEPCCFAITEGEWEPGTWSHPDSDGDGVCNLCKRFTDGTIAKTGGHSLSVDGKIGVNFYMELAPVVTDDASAKMQFTLPDGSTEEILVSAPSDKDITTKPGTTYYVFTCKVAAKEMASDIKAKIVTSTEESAESTYTVRTYADELLTKSTSDTEKAFVKAMLNYGAASQKFFNFNASDLANENSDSQTITAYTATDLVSYKPVITDDSSVLSNVKSNLVLESGTKLNVKFTAAAGADIMLNGNPVSATGTNYVISIDDLNATELDKVQTVKVNTATIACSPLSYCYSVLATSDDANLKEVVCALYDYNKAADAYIVTQ